MKSFSSKYAIVASVVAAALISSLSFAAVSNVANTPHNFSVGGNSNAYTAAPSTGITQVCVFCHTPHNAGQNRLLWNKAKNSQINFRLYTSSGTLTTTTSKASSLPAGSPSLLCLSCHDGKTAMNILHSVNGGVDASTVPGVSGYPAGTQLVPVNNGGTIPLTMPDPLPMFGGGTAPNMNIGGGSATTAGDDLTNDHPIGFSYSQAYADKLSAGGGLHNNIGMDSKIRFFGPTNRVECSTCHDPHVDSTVDPTLKPFLVKSNVGSALCLTCHDK